MDRQPHAGFLGHRRHRAQECRVAGAQIGRGHAGIAGEPPLEPGPIVDLAGDTGKARDDRPLERRLLARAHGGDPLARPRQHLGPVVRLRTRSGEG